jgi:hypothetical protein
MRSRCLEILGLAGLLLALTRPVAAEGLDWEVQEDPDAVLPVRAARNVRDGLLTFVDAFLDANTSVFGETSLLLAKAWMGVSDAVGLLDDNPVTQHVTKGIVSKSLAKTAWLLHDAGSESVLGGHGLEVERWAREDVAGLNPLLADEDREALAGPLPLDPLDFVGEGSFHDEVYRTHSTVLGLGAVLVADAALRPAAGILRILQLPGPAAGLENAGNDLVRRAARVRW